jgi:type IV pilus assembly protein PilB
VSEEHDGAKRAEELIRRDVISREDLERVRDREKSSGIPWYRQLLQLRMIDFGDLDDILRHEFHSQSVRAEHHALGDQLVKMKAITQSQLNEALVEQKRSGRLLGNILLDRGLIDRQTKAIALGKQHKLEVAPLDDTASEVEALEAVPQDVAIKYSMIPVRLARDRLTVLIENPQQAASLANVGVILGKRVHPVLTGVEDIQAEIKARYKALKTKRTADSSRAAPKTANQTSVTAAKQPSPKQKTKKTAKKRGTEDVSTAARTSEQADSTRFEEIAQQAAGVPVVKLVSTIIEGAVNSGATDVHLDPQEPDMRVRYRIDGILHDVMSIPAETEAAAVSRIKIMSDLDITETRRPQDGHISLEIGDMEYDIRVATLPTFLGERVVLRLLDQSSVLAGIKDLGLEKDDETKLVRLIRQPDGMILVTGPTGSGKTTSLYAALNQKNVMTESIVTLEDPVEYQLSGINQVQIDADIDVTFATTLRAALRQDIDVLLVGEIRDAETAHIAIRAAMTGHLVFSTLHTNDAPETISTLRNMNVPSYLISSALTAIVAQRLVRTICPECKQGFTPTKALLKSLRLPESTRKLYRGKGCPTCYHTGNKGRTGIFEVLEITPDIRRMVAAEDSPEKIAKAAKLRTMADRCRQKVKQGTITPEEFLRVIRT